MSAICYFIVPVLLGLLLPATKIQFNLHNVYVLVKRDPTDLCV